MENLNGKKDHWKAMDVEKGARKLDNYPSILSRWQNDEKCRISQLAHGWTEDYCRYLDYLTTIDISSSAPYHQRHRYENTISMKCNDTNPQPGPIESKKRLSSYHKSLGKSSCITRRSVKEPGRNHWTKIYKNS